MNKPVLARGVLYFTPPRKKAIPAFDDWDNKLSLGKNKRPRGKYLLSAPKERDLGNILLPHLDIHPPSIAKHHKKLIEILGQGQSVTIKPS